MGIGANQLLPDKPKPLTDRIEVFLIILYNVHQGYLNLSGPQGGVLGNSHVTMATLEDILNHIATTYDLPLQKINAAWLIDLPGRGDLVCQLTIAPDALEWYAIVYDQVEGKEVWKDWMDYLGYHDGKTMVELIDDKRRDLSTFIEAWLRATDARITRTKTKYFFGLFSFTSTELELYLAGQWEVAPIYDPGR